MPLYLQARKVHQKGKCSSFGEGRGERNLKIYHVASSLLVPSKEKQNLEHVLDSPELFITSDGKQSKKKG